MALAGAGGTRTGAIGDASGWARGSLDISLRQAGTTLVLGPAVTWGTETHQVIDPMNDKVDPQLERQELRVHLGIGLGIGDDNSRRSTILAVIPYVTAMHGYARCSAGCVAGDPRVAGFSETWGVAVVLEGALFPPHRKALAP
jgi:hypothetical protein